MNSGISKQAIFSFFLFINFAQPAKSAEFQKISKSENNQITPLSWTKILKNKNTSNPLLNNNFNKIPLEIKSLEI